MKRFFNPITIIFLLLLVGMMVRSTVLQGGSQGLLDWFMQRMYMLPAIVIGLSFHEYGHALVADKLGDPTARNLGRLTINPAAHMDPIGFICLFFAGFGWGIPVPIDSRNFKDPRRDAMKVTLAGVAMNALIALIFTAVLKIFILIAGTSITGMTGVVHTMILDVVVINVILMVFNLLPIPPLDGFMLITDAFALERKPWWGVVYANGFLILMVCVMFGLINAIMNPVVYGILNLLMSLV